MTLRLLLLLLFACLVPPAGSAWATAAPAAEARTPHASVALVAEQATAARGATTWVGLRFRLQPNWHIYWQNPGDSGYPPSIAWELPGGVSAGDIRWPTPERLPVGPLTNFGHTGELTLAVPISVPAAYAAGELPLLARARWLVCEDVCIPESATLALTLPVSAVARPEPAQVAAFAETRARQPAVAAPAGWRLSAARHDSGVSLRLATPSAVVIDTASFFPFDEGLMDAAAEQTLRRQGEEQVLELRAAAVPVAPWSQLAGVLVVQAAGAGTGPRQSFVVDLPLATAAASRSSPASAAGQAPAGVDTASPADGSLPLLVVVLLALAGGALLNLMPCVFPVLSIKLLALMQHEDEPIPARQHALLYSAGVVGSFLALAALLLALRAAGASLGWGFQLQSPVVVGLLAMLFFALGLSLSGGLPIGSLAADVPGTWRRRHPKVDALASGGLAVLVASPCTAPFMGAALGAALTLPAAQTLLVFAALGIGMALPFALLVRHPALRLWLPRPGPWMERLKEFLALPLYATVVWLGWVLAEQIGTTAVLTLGSGLVAVGLLAWSLRLAGWRRRGVATLALLAALAAALWPALPVGESAAPGARQTHTGATWQPWTPAALATARASQRPVFVDFTAAWCVTCQLNKRLVLERSEVLAAFARADAILLRADWTRQDPAITAELARLERGGVPVYALYPPSGEVTLLPEILSPTMVIDALRPYRRPAGDT
ncbi:MAG: thioredoxin family protein [Candidatus Accumulibacter sp.]|nr:thioredoxin family protein [Candidatus Accumulibacter conexus]